MSIKNRRETSLLVNEWRKVLKEGLYPESYFQTQNNSIDNLISECLLIENRIKVNQLLLNEAINLNSIKRAASRIGITAGSVLLALASFAGNVDAKDVNTNELSPAASKQIKQDGDAKVADRVDVREIAPGEFLITGDDGRKSKIYMPSKEDVRKQLKTVSQRMLDDLSNEMKSAGEKIIHASYNIYHLRATSSVNFKPASENLMNFSKKYIGSSKGFPTNLTISNLSVSEISLLSEAVAVVYTCHMMPEKCEQQVSGTIKTDQARAEVDVVTGSGRMKPATSSRNVVQFSSGMIELFDGAKTHANSLINEIIDGATADEAAKKHPGNENEIIMQILPQLVNEDGTLNNQAIDGVAEGPIITDDDSQKIDSIKYGGSDEGTGAENLSVRGSQSALSKALGN